MLSPQSTPTVPLTQHDFRAFLGVLLGECVFLNRNQFCIAIEALQTVAKTRS
jgi:hypothetical protein